MTWTNVSHLHDWAWDPHPGQNWATDAAYKNGSYYWYVSMAGDTVAVAKAPSPAGPWSDPLGKPLLSAALGKSLSPPAGIRDPGVLTDDDGRYYIVFGSCSGAVQPDDCCYYAAELGADMTSIKPPVHLSVHGAMGPYGPGKCDDKPFMHKHNSTYYLSWCAAAALAVLGLRRCNAALRVGVVYTAAAAAAAAAAVHRCSAAHTVCMCQYAAAGVASTQRPRAHMVPTTTKAQSSRKTRSRRISSSGT